MLKPCHQCSGARQRSQHWEEIRLWWSSSQNGISALIKEVLERKKLKNKKNWGGLPTISSWVSSSSSRFLFLSLLFFFLLKGKKDVCMDLDILLCVKNYKVRTQESFQLYEWPTDKRSFTITDVWFKTPRSCFCPHFPDDRLQSRSKLK